MQHAMSQVVTGREQLVSMHRGLRWAAATALAASMLFGMQAQGADSASLAAADDGSVQASTAHRSGRRLS